MWSYWSATDLQADTESVKAGRSPCSLSCRKKFDFDYFFLFSFFCSDVWLHFRKTLESLTILYFKFWFFDCDFNRTLHDCLPTKVWLKNNNINSTIHIQQRNICVVDTSFPVHRGAARQSPKKTLQPLGWYCLWNNDMLLMTTYSRHAMNWRDVVKPKRRKKTTIAWLMQDTKTCCTKWICSVHQKDENSFIINRIIKCAKKKWIKINHYVQRFFINLWENTPNPLLNVPDNLVKALHFQSKEKPKGESRLPWENE